MEDIDYMLALQLQEKFQNEDSVASINKENQGSANIPKGYISAASSKENNYQKSSSQPEQTTSLNDPSWEVIDPTPDIFALFGAFNERFFWSKLCAVELKWSSQMTSCAGLCSYQGRGGLCSVRLSAPLLKLRPRSDLINTLLHEMIHAYLFVTANNRDRDGHGPEFHKHMNRINKEAGTKITVYHTFHDEVRLYQKHWWRCNGPCQERKPYFGYVKRAMNRAPGPYDRWWGDHQAECGGTFIKIREPDDYGKKNKKSKSSSSTPASKPGGKDIRSFFHTPRTTKNSDSKSTSGSNSSSATIFGFNDFNKPSTGSKISSPSKINSNSNPNSNIVGFIDLNSPASKSNSNSGRSNSTSTPGRSNAASGNNSNSGRSTGFVAGGLKNKGSSTLVIPPKAQTKTEVKKPEAKKPEVEKRDNPLNIDTFKAFKTTGQTLGGQVNDKSKSRLLSMFSNQKKSSQTPTHQNSVLDGRRTVDCSSPPRSSKKPASTFSSDSKKRNDSVGGVTNSISQRNLFSNKEQSADSCIPSTSNASSDPAFSFKWSVKRRSTSPSNLDCETNRAEEVDHSPNKKSHLDSSEDVMEVDCGENDIVSCPVCTVKMKRYDLNHHLDECCGLKDIFSNSVICESDDEDIFVEKKQSKETNVKRKEHKNEKPFSSEGHSDARSRSENPHASVISISDDDEEAHKVNEDDQNANTSSDPAVPCPCCNKPIPNSQINRHLDFCLTEMALKDFS